MNDQELEALLDDHYIGEAQTLTTGAEHNLLKLAQLRGRMSAEQKERWEEVKRSFARVQAMGSGDDDPATRVVGQLGLVSDRLGQIGQMIANAGADRADRSAQPDVATTLAPVLEKLHESLAASIAAAQQQAQHPVQEKRPTAADNGEATAKALTQLAQRLEKTGETFAARLAEALSTVRTAPAEEKPQTEATQLAPYLEGLNQTMAALAKTVQTIQSVQPGTAQTTLVQALPEGVHEILDRTVEFIDDRMMTTVRTLNRKIGDSKDPEDQRLQGYLDGTLKRLDELKDLVRTLRKLDTRGMVQP
jgi:hypothetical protein